MAILPKKSFVSGTVPNPSGLQNGEIAINTADAKLWARHNNGSLVDLNPISKETFETLAQNLKEFPYEFNYTSGALTSVVYTLPSGTITKTFTYTGDVLDTITLSGDVPSGVNLNKNFTYDLDGNIETITYD